MASIKQANAEATFNINAAAHVDPAKVAGDVRGRLSYYQGM